MEELYAVMLSWAVALSGYPAPQAPAQVARVSHAFLVERACGGAECKVLGWFPPGRTIYLDQRLDPERDIVAASIVVHEYVHYLQHQAGRHGPGTCEHTVELEREAYAVQREFLLRYGVYRPVGASMHRVGCELAAEQPGGEPPAAR